MRVARELSMLRALALGLGTAWATGHFGAGLAIAVGAFLIGDRRW